MSKTILDDIITRYNKELYNKNGGVPELEIKFKNITYDTFSKIYEYMLENTDLTKASIHQLVRSLMVQKNGISNLQITNIKEIQFIDGKSQSAIYRSKTPVLVPYHYLATSGVSYKITLAIENTIKQFISNEDTIIRVINRVSFVYTDKNTNWKIDMSIIIQITGSNVSTKVGQIVNQMIKQHTVTLHNLLTLFNEDKTTQKVYKYEIEAELINNERIKLQDVTNMAHNILQIFNPDYMSENTLQSKIYDLAKYLISSPTLLQQYQNKFGMKQLLPKVQTLTRYDYKNIYPMTDFYVTDKADGVRAIVIIDINNGYILAENLITYKLDSEFKVTIADAEFVNNVAYIFDVIVINDRNISQLTFNERITYINEAVTQFKQAGLPIESKPYMQIGSNIENVIKSIYNRRDKPYNTDGLIFVDPTNNYMTTKTYKWKNIIDNTIDFLVKKAPKSVLGKKPYITKELHTLYFLFVGISNELYKALGLQTCLGYQDIFDNTNVINSTTYFPIQFSPSNAPLAYLYYHPDDNISIIENNVVEFRCIQNCDVTNGPYIGWKPIRIRNDRRRDLESKVYYGNDYRIAEITWINYLDPFPLEQLWVNVTDEYFLSNKVGMYHAQTSVISFLKTERIMKYEYHNWILDIGSGKGQDLGRYFKAHVKNLIVIDNDRASLSELVRRKFTFAQDTAKKRGSTNVYVILADMTSNYPILLDKIFDISRVPEKHINTIICNLSIHYFIYTNELLNNFISLINTLISQDGEIVITCFFGEEVFKLLSTIAEGQEWTIHENQIIKYSIRKLYSSNTLENNGQKIGVLLPFSRGEYYEEYLVNTIYLEKELTKHGYKLISKKAVSSILPEFKLKNPLVANSLTDDDKKYLSLYGELVFQRKKIK